MSYSASFCQESGQDLHQPQTNDIILGFFQIILMAGQLWTGQDGRE